MRPENNLFAEQRVELVGKSEIMKQVRLLSAKAAQVNSTVLVSGESGTGKELVARMIHRFWTRRVNSHFGMESARPFVVLNCGAIPKDLVESELFGHVRGAFTGAVLTKIGRFEAAHQGTMFLDEIGELPMPAQVKVLRVLQDGTFSKVGSVEEKQVSVRVVTATNKNLASAMRRGEFREDLFYRISVFPINIAPLRHRLVDIPGLAEYYFRRYNSRCESAGEVPVQLPVTGEILELLKKKSWPGNVRELFNVLERATALTAVSRDEHDSRIKVLKPEDFSFLNDPSEEFSEGVKAAIGTSMSWDTLRDMHFSAVFEKTGRSKTHTARVLDVSLRTVRTHLIRLGYKGDLQD